MPIFRIRPDQSANFAASPEFAMGLQFARLPDADGDWYRFIPVIDSQVAIKFDDQVSSQIQTAREFGLWDVRRDRLGEEDEESRAEAWLSQLPLSPPIELIDPTVARDWPFLFLGPDGPLRPPPRFPEGGIYGHLPFAAASGSDDVYYRYEAFPSSKRVNQAAGTIAAQTYAAPASELPFMPTGLSVVARCALPSVLPARWRWEIQPEAPTSIRCGASVPLYGQSGGGVEVMFPHVVKNRGPIANPVVLPVL